MNKKVKFIFITLCFILFLSFLTNSMVNAIGEKNKVQITDLEVDLSYTKNPILYDITYFWIWMYSYDGPITINIVDLTITNSTHALQIYSNPSPIYLDSATPYFDKEVSLQFNKTETWNITLFVETAAGDQYLEEGQFKVSPFRLGLYHMEEAYVNKPTEFQIDVEYADTIPNKDISIEVLLDDYVINVSIYNSLHTFTVGPDIYTTSFFHTFVSTGSFKLWLNVTDLGTKQQWFTWDYIYPEWINVTIISDYHLFVGNLTKIEIELNSYHPSSIEVDALLTIEEEMGYDYYIMNSYAWPNIQLTPTTPRFNDSITLTFQENGEYYIRLEVEDDANNEYMYDSDWMEVYNEVDLRIYQPMEIWDGNEYWADLEIRYFKSKTVTADIEFYIDDGVSTTYLVQNYDVTFFGQTPYSFNYHYWWEYVNQVPSQMGYFDAWLRVYIQDTMEEYLEHCWFYVRGDDTTPPVIIDTDGLNDGETYSDVISITANVTDDQSDMYKVYLDVENENFTERYQFNTEITNYIYKAYCHCYATLELDTTDIYDGKYEVTIEAEDKKGYITTESFTVRFENGYIYVPSDGDDDDDDDKVSPGFEGIGLILSLIVVVGLVKRRKQE